MVDGRHIPCCYCMVQHPVQSECLHIEIGDCVLSNQTIMYNFHSLVVRASEAQFEVVKHSNKTTQWGKGQSQERYSRLPQSQSYDVTWVIIFIQDNTTEHEPCGKKLTLWRLCLSARDAPQNTEFYRVSGEKTFAFLKPERQKGGGRTRDLPENTRHSANVGLM